MKTVLRSGEKIIKEGRANLQRGMETVGGKLYLTNLRLVFESHMLNFQRGTTEIEISNIQSAQPTWTKFLGLIPLAPNSLAVFTKEGEEFCFVVFKRYEWDTAIKKQVSNKIQ